MVTSSPIPEEANEPSEPPLPPASSRSSSISSTSSNRFVSSGSTSPALVLPSSSPGDYYSSLPGLKAGERKLLDVEKTAGVEAVTASGGSSFTYTGSSFTPAGTTAVVSKGTSEKLQSSGQSVSSASSSESSSSSGPYEGTNAHCFTPADVAASLGTSLQDGLPAADAQERLARDGPNKLEGEEGVGVWRVLLRQVSNSLTLVSWARFPFPLSECFPFFACRRDCCIASASHFLFLRVV
ncbi:hypothetical protein DFH27DRAFT_382233 [Peziza echinospora]|nr:hypothetical protein DFH27DRAFT_382233 [Peziza echinospora]